MIFHQCIIISLQDIRIQSIIKQIAIVMNHSGSLCNLDASVFLIIMPPISISREYSQFWLIASKPIWLGYAIVLTV